MNILFISQYYPEQLVKKFQSNAKVSLDYAAQNLQTALFTGFEMNGQDISVINVPHLGSFPFFAKSPFVTKYKSKDKQLSSISYFNVPYLKWNSIRRQVYKLASNWSKRVKGEKVIFLYSYDFLPEISRIKTKDPETKICLLVADLPEYLSADDNKLTKLNEIITKIFPRRILTYDFVDGFVLLSKYMRERLPINGKPYLILEGIYNSDIDVSGVEKEENKIILYTGALGKRYGIIDLLDAFSLIKRDDYRLWFCGSGDALDEIKRRSITDSRIVYKGIFPRKEIIKMQKQATLLINPRHSFEEYTKYSFPSKSMEYMASATPTLMAKLKCIPSEYDPYIYFFGDETIEGYASKIEEICEKTASYLNDFGKKASEFIMKNKTPRPQVAKIISFLESI